jgi:hypothetical protein
MLLSYLRWDKKKKAYVNTAGVEDKRGLKLRKIRTESGKTVLAGPGKGEATGQLYKKWAKHNKQRIAATGAACAGSVRHVRQDTVLFSACSFSMFSG